MPFREKMRKAFGRSSTRSSDSSSSLTQVDSRKNSNIYQPGEPMPRMKYRAPPEKKHKAHLESFSFSDAWRRKSNPSIYSPFGSKMPSRNSSIGDKGSHANNVSHIEQTVVEGQDEDDPSNVGGLSRKHSLKHEHHHHHHQLKKLSQLPNGASRKQAPTSAPDHQPFTEHDINQAILKTGLQSSTDAT